MRQFLRRFEDEESRLEAKIQMQRLTFQQKEMKKAAWAQREEEKQILLEEEKRQEEQKRMLKEEEERRRNAAEEKRKKEMEDERKKKEEQIQSRKIQEAREREQERLRQEEEAAKVPKELPKISAPTCSRMKEKIEQSMSGTSLNKQSKSSPPVGKLNVTNPFDVSPKEKVSADLVIPEVKGNDLKDIKKKYLRLTSQSSTVDKIKKSQNEVTCDGIPPEKDLGQSVETVEVVTKVDDTCCDYNNSDIEAEELTIVPNQHKAPKKSTEEMQNYLLSHLLFDGTMEEKSPPKKDSIEDFIDSLGEVQVDPEYVREIEQYLAFVEDDEKPRMKKKRKAKPNMPKLKIVEISSLKNQLEKQFGKKSDNSPAPISRSTSADVENSDITNVNKVKGLFDSPPSNGTPNQSGRKTNLLSADLIKKFDSPEMTEKLRKQKEQEREERRFKRLQILEQERVRQEEEIKRLEEEKLEAQRQEELKRQEKEKLLREEMEKEELERAKYEEMIRQERQIAEEHKKKRQQKEAEAEKDKKPKKVLNRIQHILEKKPDRKENKNIGQVNANDVFTSNSGVGDESGLKKAFQDASLTGVSAVLSKIKKQLESPEVQQTPVISKGVEKKPQLNPVALTFELKEQLAQNEMILSSPKSGESNQEWSWKKKTEEERVSVDLPQKKKYFTESKKAEKQEREAKRRQDLEEIRKLTARLQKKDHHLEQERKVKEYEELMKEVNGYLEDTVVVESDKEKPSKGGKKQLSKPGKLLHFVNVDDLKATFGAKDASSGRAQASNPKSKKNLGKQQQVKKVQGKLLKQQNPSKPLKGRLTKEKEQKSVKELAENLTPHAEAPNITNRSKPSEKSAYDWKYKQKDIKDFQKFLLDNKDLLPNNVIHKAREIEKNLGDVEMSSGTDVTDYDNFVHEVETFLNAPDQSATEVNFKSEIERHLDLIDEPPKIVSKKNANNLRNRLIKEMSSHEEKEVDSEVSFTSSDESNEDNLRKDKEMESFMNEIDDFIVKSGEQGDEYATELQNYLEDMESHPTSNTETGDETDIIELSDDFDTFMKEIDSYIERCGDKGQDRAEELKGFLDRIEQQPRKPQPKKFHYQFQPKQSQRSNPVSCKNYVNEKISPSAVKVNHGQVDRAKASLLEPKPDQSNTKEAKQVGSLKALEIMKELKIKDAKKLDTRNEPKTAGKKREKTDTVEAIPTTKRNEEKPKETMQNQLETLANEKPKAIVKTGKIDESRKLQLQQILKLNEPVQEEKVLRKAPRSKLIPAKSPVVEVSPMPGNFRSTHSKTYKWSADKTRALAAAALEEQQKQLAKQSEGRDGKEATNVRPPVKYLNDEENRKKAILAKYGSKPRSMATTATEQNKKDKDLQAILSKYSADPPLNKSISLQREDSSSDEEIPLHVLMDDQLYQRYRLSIVKGMADDECISSVKERLKVFQGDDPKGDNGKSGSFGELKNLLKNNAMKSKDSKNIESPLCGEELLFNFGKQEDISIGPDAYKSLRSKFEQNIPRSRSCANLTQALEKKLPQPARLLPPKRSLTINQPQMFNDTAKKRSQSFAIPSRKSSFDKFRRAFERGSTDDVDEDDSMKGLLPGSSVKAELEALKQSPRLQNLLRINRPKDLEPEGLPVKSRSSTNLNTDLDDEAMASVAKSKSAIKTIFASSTPKVTFGRGAENNFGAKSRQMHAKAPESSKLGGRKWVFDTINKYFDVIKEEDDDDERKLSENEEDSYLNYSMSGNGSTVLRADQTPSALTRSRSSSKLRDMVSSIVKKSNSSVSIDAFKENLSMHLRTRSRESLSGGAATPYSLHKKISCNQEPGVNDSDDDGTNIEDELFTRIPL